jgi:hypothetical protein
LQRSVSEAWPTGCAFSLLWMRTTRSRQIVESHF